MKKKNGFWKKASKKVGSGLKEAGRESYKITKSKVKSKLEKIKKSQKKKRWATPEEFTRAMFG